MHSDVGDATDEELRQEYVALAARADTWSEEERSRFELVVLERFRRTQLSELHPGTIHGESDQHSNVAYDYRPTAFSRGKAT